MFTLFDQDDVMQRHIEYESRLAMEKGIEKGREEGESNIIKNMLSLNIPIEQIVKASGWSENQILALK